MPEQLLTGEQREEILQREITHYRRRGFNVISQTQTSVSLLKPKKFSLLVALLTLIFGVGIGLLVYIIYFIGIKKDETVYLNVDEHGKVKTS
jgi:hypothetical protein